MKVYTILFYFVFQLTAFAQSDIIINDNLENKSFLLGNGNVKDIESKENIISAKIFNISNENCTVEVQLIDSCVSNRLYYLRSPLKKLNISQNIDLDYWVFTKKEII